MWNQLVDVTRERHVFVDDQTLEFNFRQLTSFTTCLQELGHISQEQCNEMTSKLNQVSDYICLSLASACRSKSAFSSAAFSMTSTYFELPFTS